MTNSFVIFETFDEKLRQTWQMGGLIREMASMARKASPQPTDVELAILRVLWARGPSTVREVHLALASEPERETGYSTTLKMMQVMLEKGLLTRDESVRPQVYAPAQPEEQTQRQILRDVLDRK